MKIRHLAATMVGLVLILASVTFIYKKNTPSTPTIQPDIVSHFDLNKINLANIKSEQDLSTWLQQAEASIWLEIKEAFNLTQAECNKLKKTCKQDYEDSIKSMKEKYGSGQSLSQTTIEYVKGIMSEFNVSCDGVDFVAWNIDLPGSAMDTVIFINEKLLNSLDPQTKKFIIGHELIHLIHKDHSTRFFIRNSTPLKELKENDSNNPLNKLCTFHELRADILANLHGTDYAEGAITFMKQQIEKFGDCKMHAYPKYSVRQNIGSKISHLLHSNATKNTTVA